MDLWFGSTICLAAFAAFLLHGPAALRGPLAFAILFLVPGYGILAAAYPLDHSPPHKSGASLAWGERLGYSMLISVLATSLVVIVLAALTVPLTSASVGVTATGAATLSLMLAFAARSTTPRRQALRMPWPTKGGPWSGGERLLAGALATCVLLLLLLVLLPTPLFAPKPYVGFYVLGPAGDAVCYPTLFENRSYVATAHGVRCPGEARNITIGLINHEGGLRDYTFTMAWSSQADAGSGNPVMSWSVTLPEAPKPKEGTVAFEPQYEHTLALPEPPRDGEQYLILGLHHGAEGEPFEVLRLRIDASHS